MLDPADGVARAGQRRPPARRWSSRPTGAAAFLEPQRRRRARGDARRRATRRDASRCRPARPCCSTPTGSSSAAASRSTSASSGCARSPTGSRDVETAVRDGRRRGWCPTEPADDIAFVAARVPPLREHADARAGRRRRTASPPIRQLLRRWLRRRGATDDETYDIIVALPGGVRERDRARVRPGPARSSRSRPSYEDGRVTAHGRATAARWRAAARRRNRGRGIPLMQALMDTVEVRQTDEGTDGRAGPSGSGRRRHDAARAPHRGAARRLPVARVQGEIDASNVVLARRRGCARCSRTVATALVVDLAGTTYLDSAGIALLFGLAASCGAPAAAAARGHRQASPIARMVALTGLDAAVPTHATLEAAAAD